MKRFISTKFFLLLKEASQKGINKDAKVLQYDYDKFVESVFQGRAAFRSKAAYRDALEYTRVELATLPEVSGKNAAIYLHKATELIDSQTAWVEKQILAEQAANSCLLCRTEKELPSLKWTGSIAEWVELIYALYLVKRINNGNISLKNLFRQMGEMFDFEVKEFANYFMSLKNRMDKNRTKFTDLMRNSVFERMTESDRKPGRK
jgi:hypothetical protein